MRNLLFLSLLCPLLSMCQPLTLSGKIINEEGEPVSSATITLWRTRQSVKASGDGSFALPNIRLNDTLTITAVGYVTQNEVFDPSLRTVLTITLKRRVARLEEVVVNTGYQTIAKERATGSFTLISNEALNQQVGPNIINRLEGVASGLSFEKRGLAPTISVRGLSTIHGPRDPLIILDDFPYEGKIENINPADIESVTLLKDAAAASIWGVRAGNGVIVITTKKGRFNQKLRIELTTTLSLTGKPDVFYTRPISATDYIDVETFLFSKSFRFSDTLTTSRPVFSPVYEILFQQRKGVLSPGEATAQITALRSVDVRNDFDRYLYREGLAQQYALNLRGGSATASWYVSAGADKSLSVLSAPLSRLTLRSQTILRLTPSTRLSLDFNYVQSRAENGRPGYGDIVPGNPYVKLWPYARLADGDGNPLPLANKYRLPFADTAGGGLLLNWNYFPLRDYLYNHSTTDLQQVLFHLDLEQQLFKGLVADLKFQYQKQQTTTEQLSDPESFFVRDLVNTFSQVNRATGTVKYIVPPGGILSTSLGETEATNLRAQLRYSNSWSHHGVDAIAGVELKDAQNNSASNRLYGFNKDILVSSNVDYVTSYPSYLAGFTTIPSSASVGEQRYRFVSFYANSAYTFRNNYTFSLSGRRDASNLFGVATNDKWNPLWSAGFAWTISKERFYRVAALPFVKLRITYGYSGNIDQGRSAVTTINYFGTATSTNFPNASISQNANPELRWEKIALLNFGLDFRTREGRINGSLEYYRKKGTDLFGPWPVDLTAGVGPSLFKNVANIKGHGVDLSLQTLNIDRGFKWSTGFLLSYNADQVTKYFAANTQGSSHINDGLTISPLEGKPVYAILSYKWGGLDPLTGDPQGYLNKTLSKDYTALTGAQTTVDDLVYSGPARPRMFGAFTNTISWRGLSLSANLTYRLGYYFRKQALSYVGLFNQGNGNADFARRWQKPGDEKITDVPSMIYPAVSSRDALYGLSEATVLRGDNIRLQFVNLVYTLNKTALQKLPLQELQFFISTANLGLVWRANREGIDPDYSSAVIPPSRTISFGLRTNFK